MTIRMSSALKTAIATNYGLGQLLQGGHIRLYSGEQPAGADAAPTGTYLGYITRQGLPVPSIISPQGGLLLQQSPSIAGQLLRRDQWLLTGVATGVFGWWRWVSINQNPDGISTTAYRLDGSAEDSFSEGVIGAITAATRASIALFSLTIET